MPVIERDPIEVHVCPTCGDVGGGQCAGTTSAPHGLVDTVVMRYVPEPATEQLRGLVREARDVVVQTVEWPVGRRYRWAMDVDALLATKGST